MAFPTVILKKKINMAASSRGQRSMKIWFKVWHLLQFLFFGEKTNQIHHFATKWLPNLSHRSGVLARTVGGRYTAAEVSPEFESVSASVDPIKIADKVAVPENKGGAESFLRDAWSAEPAASIWLWPSEPNISDISEGFKRFSVASREA